MSKLKNENGFSLVEILIATGLAVGLSLVIGQLMQQGNRVVKTSQVGLDTLEFHALLKDTFMDQASCTRTFARVMSTGGTPTLVRDGFAPSAANILDTSGIYNADGNVVWQKDDAVAGNLKLKSITIPTQKLNLTTNSLVTNFTAINTPLSKGLLEVHIGLEKTDNLKNSYGSKNKLIKLDLTVEVYNAAANDLRIKECRVSGSGSLAKEKMIYCSKAISHSFSGLGTYAFSFDAANCEGGVLPDTTYRGIPIEISACNGEYNASVLNAGDSYPTSFDGTVTGPGAKFWATNPCTWPGSPYQASMAVVFIKK
jgi:type II secretory pathway pseudopilin PulG